jgi:hypothetical protein
MMLKDMSQVGGRTRPPKQSRRSQRTAYSYEYSADLPTNDEFSTNAPEGTKPEAEWLADSPTNDNANGWQIGTEWLADSPTQIKEPIGVVTLPHRRVTTPPNILQVVTEPPTLEEFERIEARLLTDYGSLTDAERELYHVGHDRYRKQQAT